MTQGTLKVQAKRKASASGLEIDCTMLTASAALSCTAVLEKKVASSRLLCPTKVAFSTPNTASLAKAELRNAIKVCQPRPKKRVTGSMAVPTR